VFWTLTLEITTHPAPKPITDTKFICGVKMQGPSKVRRVTHDVAEEEIHDELLPEHTMTDEQRLSLYVRTVLCGDGCYFMDYTISTLGRRFKCGVSAAADGQMTTWMPKIHVPVLIVGTNTQQNIIVLCRSGETFNMSLHLGVAPLPAGVCLVCNCTVNRDGTFQVLVYDGENIPIGNAQPGLASPSPKEAVPTSIERYQRLREFFPRIFHHSELAISTFMIQWVGYYENAVQFLTGEIPVPHDISGLLSTTNDALTPSRPVRVKIPTLVIRRFQGST
jgi:hypothetical protein